MTWTPQKLTRRQLEERRLEGGRLLRDSSLSKAQIAARLGVSRTAVSQWAKRARTGGLRRLAAGVSAGRPSKLTRQQQRALLRQLQRGALAAGFPTDRWALSRIAHMIEREFSVKYHPKYLSRFLRRLGWTPQLPQPVPAERDEELIRAWLEKDWPRIKKSAAARRRDRPL
jgi:transposase